MALQLGHLNSQQREAVIYPSGPLLILAGAGSGKTSTMAYRIAHLIAERNVAAFHILGLSFTNKAATELKERVTKLVSQHSGRQAVRGLTITTFHSLCARLLRKHADRLGFQTGFTILDENDQVDVLRQVLRNIKIDERRFDPSVILFEIGQVKNRFLGPEAAEHYFLEAGRLSPDYALAAASSYVRYQEQLRVLNAMDFDDLIFQTVRLLESCEDVRAHYNSRFKHILVDEYQDTNAAQFKILKLLTEKTQNLCVVGDDDQSIYAWRGADPTHILEFDRHYPQTAKITLEQNYRSTSRILDAANSVIEKNKSRYPKKLWSDRGVGEPLTEVLVEDDRTEADFVSEEILRRSTEYGRNWRDFVILYRSNSQSRVFEEALRRKGIPYRIIGGLSFLARKEVKDILAYWRLVVNPKDDASLRRILNWPARGIGKSSVETLGKYAFEKGLSLFEIFSEAHHLIPKTASAVLGFQNLILELQRELEQMTPTPEAVAIWGRRMLEKVQAKRAVEEDCDDSIQALKKWENVEELIHSLGQFKVEESVAADSVEAEAETTGSSRSGVDFLRLFLNRMTLEAQEDEKENEMEGTQKNQVTLLTLHAAKGLEFPIVFMVGMEEGFLPHRRTLEEATDLGEERRLCYVGITRAKDFLFLTRAKNRIRYGKPLPRIPSRFFADIPKDLIVQINEAGFSSDTPAGLTSKQAQEEHEVRVKNFLSDIRARLTKPPLK